jgi:nucleoid-associated protein YgaU
VAEIAPASRSHTVVAGDNLSKIARKYYGGTDAVATLCDANGIRPGDILRPGQVLRIPAGKSTAR